MTMMMIDGVGGVGSGKNELDNIFVHGSELKLVKNMIPWIISQSLHRYDLQLASLS